ncbi:MAG: ribose-phosphate pyrophosphokinase [Lachnospiraceae bacterium]|nr:ribose-phosphate pyrophosphokinase [Lachnospiraceae bacterium]MBR5738365.1 ribose-phosphate pyrophosphokinase [Lachnospiraceae bacterium]
MIFLNGCKIEHKYFTDGTFDIKIDPSLLAEGKTNVIRWLFDTNEELIIVCYLKKHLETKGISDVVLEMPYIPNARKDRAQREIDVFTLKYFADILNGLHFSSVKVLDPHSMVSEALIDRIRVEWPEAYIRKVCEILADPCVIAFYPDEGAMKRYSDRIKLPYAYGSKVRDKTTRVILSLDILGDVEMVQGSSVLMIDDICSSGKTLCTAAKKLKEMGAKSIYVYISHCENTVLKSELLDVADRIFTTDSIYRGDHEKIVVLE